MLARLIQIAALLAAVLTLGSVGARADLFTSPAVPVDVRAETATAAQQEAVAEASRTALGEILRRLTPEEEQGGLPSVAGFNAEAMVTGMQILDEKLSAGRYAAEIAFQFDPDSVRDILGQSGVPYTEARALPVLIVPVLTEAGQASIWTDTSPWLNAWASLDGSQHLVPPVVPFGDVEDVVTLTAGQALAGDEGSILALARRYGAESAMVVHAALAIDAVNGNADVDVQVQSYGPDNYAPFASSFSGAAPQGAEKFLTAIAELLMDDLDRQWKTVAIQRFAVENELTALAPVTGLEDWLDIQARIGRIHLVRAQTLKALTVRDAVIDIRYGGEPELLQDALARAGLSLQQQPDGFWLIDRRGARQ